MYGGMKISHVFNDISLNLGNAVENKTAKGILVIQLLSMRIFKEKKKLFVSRFFFLFSIF